MKKDKHRKVKIDYSVLQEFLNYIIYNDGYCNYSIGLADYTCFNFPKEIKEKARNILENS